MYFLSRERSELQLYQKEVKYLAFILREGQTQINPQKVDTIVKFPHLGTKRQVQEFLGVVGFCQLRIPGLRELTKLLKEAARDEEVESTTWGPERE